MPTTYFNFKQFTVHQDLAAMKVGTDGVLLGAWASVKNVQSALDVGTGTGLIALMLAQKTTDAIIDAVEIDEQACQQSIINFKASNWNDRLHVAHSDFQNFSPNKKYDLIVSNPPFFNNSLKNDCHKKTKARHTDSLSFSELIKETASLLNNNGRFCVILPADEKENFQEIALTCHLYLNKILYVKPTPTKPPKRVLMEFSFSETKISEDEMILEEFGRHLYSEKFKKLTGDFYLGFKERC